MKSCNCYPEKNEFESCIIDRYMINKGSVMFRGKTFCLLTISSKIQPKAVMEKKIVKKVVVKREFIL